MIQFLHPMVVLITRDIQFSHQRHGTMRPFQGFGIIAALVLVILGQFNVGIHLAAAGSLLPQPERRFQVTAPLLETGKTLYGQPEIGFG